MGRYKARLIDKNRFCKKYPFVRAPKRLVFQSSSDMALELGQITFNNATTGVLVFEVPFDDKDYTVVAVPRDTTSTDSAQVNVYVDNANSSRFQVKVDSSAPFTGIVDVLAVRIS